MFEGVFLFIYSFSILLILIPSFVVVLFFVCLFFEIVFLFVTVLAVLEIAL